MLLIESAEDESSTQCDVFSETTDDTDEHRFFLMSHRNKGNNGNNFSANLSARRSQCQRFLREKNIYFVLIGLIELITMIIGPPEKFM